MRSLAATRSSTRVLHEEHEAKQQLSEARGHGYRLEGSSSPSSRSSGDAVLDHAQHEENRGIHQAERELTADDRKRMAGAVLAAEAIAPTRPHAGVESAKANFARRAVRVDARPRA